MFLLQRRAINTVSVIILFCLFKYYYQIGMNRVMITNPGIHVVGINIG